jgi:hypothetical protein
MSKVSSQEDIQLIPNAKSYLLMGSDESIQTKNIAHFLKFKSNPFFKTCQKVLHPLVYHKIMLEVISKFRDNINIKPYGLLKDAIQRYYQKP